MEEMYFTIAGCSHYYGTQFMEKGMKVKLVKEPDNEYDKEAIQVKIKGLGKVGYVFRLSVCHAHRLQARDSRRKYRFGIYLTEIISHPLPDRRLRLCRYLLPYDMVNDRGEYIAVDLAVYMP